MKKIRRNVFETNSSSTHAMCIALVNEIKLRDVHFELGEFGWELDTLSDLHSKASYLWTALEKGEEYDKSKLLSFLDKLGVKYSVEEEQEGYFYIDHSEGLHDFLKKTLQSPLSLARFLFSPLSFILTGNDNDDHSVDIDVSYPHVSAYKGN